MAVYRTFYTMCLLIITIIIIIIFVSILHYVECI